MATFTPIDTTASVNELKEGGILEISHSNSENAENSELHTSYKRSLHNQRRGGAKETPVPLGIVIDKSCRVYIRNIPVEHIERDGALALKAEFESFGPVESYKLFTERSGRFVGSALCTYRNPADATLAIREMNGRELDGTTLQVMPAREHGVVVLNKNKGKNFYNNESVRSYQHKYQTWSGRPRGFLPDSDDDDDDDDDDNNNRKLSNTNAHNIDINNQSSNDVFGAQATNYYTDLNSNIGFPQTNNVSSNMEMFQLGATESANDNNNTNNKNISKSSGKWRHDKYEMQLEGRPPEEIFGIDYTSSGNTFSPFAFPAQHYNNDKDRLRSGGRGWDKGRGAGRGRGRGQR